MYKKLITSLKFAKNFQKISVLPSYFRLNRVQFCEYNFNTFHLLVFNFTVWQRYSRVLIDPWVLYISRNTQELQIIAHDLILIRKCTT